MRILFLTLLLAGCANEPQVAIYVSDPSYLLAEVPAENPGVASWYGERYRGRPTASGELFDPGAMTAAHRTLPFGTRLLVKRGSKSVVVTVNDRGPFVPGRDLDLSWAAFQKLADPDLGLIEVTFVGVSSLK